MLGVEGGGQRQTAAPTIRGRRLILVAAGVSSLGDGMWAAAIPLAAAMIDRNPSAVAAVSAAALLPWLIVAPMAGALADRWPRRRVLVLGDAVRGAIIIAVVGTFLAGMVTVPILAVASFLVVSGGIVHGAAQQSLVADLTDDDAAGRDWMNGRMSSLEVGGTSLAGPPLGSASYAAANWIPFLADAASFVFSAVCMAAVPMETDGRKAEKEPFRSAVWAGVSFLIRHRQLRTLALLTGVANLTTNCALVVLVLYATDSDGLGLSEASFGLLIAALAAGGVVAGPLAPRLLRRLGDRNLVIAALVVRAVVWPTVALTDQPVVAGIALAAAGFASTCVTVTVTSARQRMSPRPMLGRIVTAFRTLGNGAAPLGAVLGGAIATSLGLRAAFFVAGGLLAVAVLAALPYPAPPRSAR